MLITSYHQSKVPVKHKEEFSDEMFINSLMLQVLDTDTEDASHPGISAYQFMLEQNVGKTMLQFQVRERVLITAIYLTQYGCQP